MKVVIFGASGFIGSSVREEMINAGHEVFVASDEAGSSISLLKTDEVKKYLSSTRPDIIVNCAGIVDQKRNFENNEIFSRTILESVNLAGIKPKKVIISGSSAVYGEVDRLPVSEETKLAGDSAYALSKIKEEQISVQLGKQYNIPVVIARIFNPIGPGMKKKFLAVNLWDQLQESTSKAIHLSRLDSKRDYLAVKDVASAFRNISEGNANHSVYNIGSGISTSNEALLKLLIGISGIKSEFEVIETSAHPEPQVASQADISRIHEDFGWLPTHDLKEALQEAIK